MEDFGVLWVNHSVWDSAGISAGLSVGICDGYADRSLTPTAALDSRYAPPSSCSFNTIVKLNHHNRHPARTVLNTNAKQFYSRFCVVSHA